MLAGCFPAAGKVELAEISEPAFPDASLPPEQILFQPEVTCLCGSDLPFFDGDFEGHAIEYPQPVGMSLHEMVGTVIQSTCHRWKPGARVLAVPPGQRGLFERCALPADRVVGLVPGLSDELAMQWIAERRVDLAPLITHRFPLSQIQDAFNVFRDRIDGALKVVVNFPALAARSRPEVNVDPDRPDYNSSTR
jgi:threonine dehydrogenase-like Zn-dependent dehydrogenase